MGEKEVKEVKAEDGERKPEVKKDAKERSGKRDGKSERGRSRERSRKDKSADRSDAKSKDRSVHKSKDRSEAKSKERSEHKPKDGGKDEAPAKSSDKVKDRSNGKSTERSRDKSREERGRDKSKDRAKERSSEKAKVTSKRRSHREASSSPEAKARREATPTRLHIGAMGDFQMWRDEREGRRPVCSRWEFSRYDDDQKRARDREAALAARGGFDGGFQGGFRGRGRGRGGYYPAQPPPPLHPPSAPGASFKANFRIYPSRMFDRPTEVLLSERWERAKEGGGREAAGADPPAPDHHRADQPFHRPTGPAFGGGHPEPPLSPIHPSARPSMRGRLGPTPPRAELGWREAKEAEARPTLHLFDPTSVPKGRQYFDHDNRDSFVPRSQGGAYRGQRGGGGSYRDGGRYEEGSGWAGERRARGSFPDKGRGGAYRPYRERSRTDGAWGHDGFQELQQQEGAD